MSNSGVHPPRAATLPRVTPRKSYGRRPFDDEAVVDPTMGREDHGEVRTDEDIREVRS